MPSPQEPTALQAAAQALLRRHGAMDLSALAARLLAEGFDLGGEPEAVLDHELVARDDLDELPDGRQLDLATTVDGAVATTRLSAEEITTALVRVEPELELLLLPDVDAFPLPDGHRAELALRGAGEDPEADLGVWLASGPPGWLDHLRAGELAAFRLTGGALHVQPAGTPADPDGAVAALADAFDEHSVDDEPIETRQLLLAVLVDWPHVLREPLPPLTDLLDAAGLEIDGDWVGEQATDWGSWGSDDEAWGYGLDADGREALGIVLAGFTLSLEEGPDELAARPDLAEGLATCLSYDGVAEAFLAAVLAGADETQAAATAGWASLLSDMASSQPGPHLVLAGCAEHAGDVESGQRALAEALRADPESPAALRDAAWYAEDRGDAAGALTLLRRAGVEPDDPDVVRLERFAAPGPMAAGRNEACPCGSGRKYKVCCAVRNGYPLHTRVWWLLAKAGTYARRPPARPLVAVVALARTGGDPEDLGGTVSACGYLVDPYCLGVKNALGPRVMGRGELRRFLGEFFGPFDAAPIDAPLDLARHLVSGALAYARGLGFAPHADFGPAAGHLGPPLEGPSAIGFGCDGIPSYTQGPFDDADRVLRTLRAHVGDDFHFTVACSPDGLARVP